MALYNLYAGLGGGFGGYKYCDTDEFETLEEAEHAAYDLAVEEYESYGGNGGLRTYDDIRESYMEEEGIVEIEELGESDHEEIQTLYMEEVEGWICYRAALASEDPEKEDYE